MRNKRLKQECLEEWFFYLKLSDKEQRKRTFKKDSINNQYYKMQVSKHKQKYKQPKQIKITTYE